MFRPQWGHHQFSDKITVTENKLFDIIVKHDSRYTAQHKLHAVAKKNLQCATYHDVSKTLAIE